MTGQPEKQAADTAPAPADEAVSTVEAILFSTDAPLSAAKIAQVADLSSKREVSQAVDALNARYAESGSAFRIESVAGGYRLQTLEAYHDVLSRLFKAKSESRLSQPAMETLAIVAYRQPVLRADIEAIRGVACGEVLRGLLDKQLIKIVGRAEVIGRPMLYGTTRRFLEVFGLGGLGDLPQAEELRQAAKKAKSVPKPSRNDEGQQGDSDAPESPAGPTEAKGAESQPPSPKDAPAD